MRYLLKVAHGRHGGSRGIICDVEVHWGVVGLTKSENSRFLQVSVFDLLALPPPHLVWVVVDMAMKTMAQTPKTKSVTISLLKHLTGVPLGTTTTLVDHWFMSEASLPQIKTAFVSLTNMFGGVVIKANVTNFK